MEQKTHRTYQLIWTSQNGRFQCSVTCETFEDFLDAWEQIRTIFPFDEFITNGTLHLDASTHIANASSEPPEKPERVEIPLPPSETTGPVCYLHTDKFGHPTPLRLRTGKGGKQWWDHRWQENGVWMQCNGKDTKPNSTKGA